MAAFPALCPRPTAPPHPPDRCCMRGWQPRRRRCCTPSQQSLQGKGPGAGAALSEPASFASGNVSLGECTSAERRLCCVPVSWRCSCLHPCMPHSLHTAPCVPCSQRTRELLLCYCTLLQAGGPLHRESRSRACKLQCRCRFLATRTPRPDSFLCTASFTTSACVTEKQPLVPSPLPAEGELEGRCRQLLARKPGQKALSLEAGPPLAQLQAWGLATAAEPAGAGSGAGGAGGGSGGWGMEGQAVLVAAPLPDALRTLRQVWADLGSNAEEEGWAQERAAGDSPAAAARAAKEERWEEAGAAAAVPAVQSLSRWLRARTGTATPAGAAQHSGQGRPSGQPVQAAAAQADTPALATPPGAGQARRPGAVAAARLAP